MDNIHFSQDMIKSDSLFLSELWKQTNTFSWSASACWVFINFKRGANDSNHWFNGRIQEEIWGHQM